MEKKLEKTTLAAGWFWCVEAVFQRLKGVKSVVPGYTGGAKPNPTYEEVCSGATGHAEAAQITFDPKQISYEKLLKVFWKAHDPTQLNRQGPDTGKQYRSAIFFHNKEQEATAKKSKETLEKSRRFPSKIVTEIKPAANFWKAEEYHQQYLRKQGLDSCHS